MIGRGYWSTGITLRLGAGVANGQDGWAAEVKFYDDGFSGSDALRVSTEGEVRTRYFVSDSDTQNAAVAAAQAIKRDAAGMGIKFVVDPIAGSPLLYLHRDNWASPDTERGSDEVETTLGAVALAIGWFGSRRWLLSPRDVTGPNPHEIDDPDVAATLPNNTSAADKARAVDAKDMEQPAAPLADIVPPTGAITATALRRAIEAQCEVADGSVAGYVTVDSVLDLIELANTLNYIARPKMNVR